MDSNCVYKSPDITDLTQYTWESMPYAYGLVEILCIYCSIRSCTMMGGFYKSFMLTIFYIATHTLLITRILFALGELLIEQQSCMEHTLIVCAQITITICKDIVALSLVGRVFELLAEVLTRYSRDYIVWKALVWILVIVHVLGFFTFNFLRVYLKWRQESAIYEIAALTLIAIISILGSIKYLAAFKKAVPDAFDSVKCSVYTLFSLLNLSIATRIFFQVWNMADIVIPDKPGSPEDAMAIGYFILTEILPVIVLLGYIIIEFRNKELNVMALGSFLSMEDIIDQPEYSDANSSSKV